MNIFFRRVVNIKSLVRFYSLGKKTHYEILNLRPNCTSKDIREAYIKLSKAYHPDKNNDINAPQNFIEISEAYNVLSNKNTRAYYDKSMNIEHNATYVYKTHVPYNLRNNPSYGYYDNHKGQGTKYGDEAKGYYGVSGWKKLPNYIIIVLCFCFALVGLVIQLAIISNTFYFHRRRAIERSKRNAEELERVRAAAVENGNRLQSRILMNKIITAANPTAATASLGKELASEKK